MLLGDDDELNKAEEGLSIAPLIDCVFLLLIYFVTSTSLRQLEADLGIRLPGNVQLSKSVEMPDEQIVEISADGRIILNNTTYSETPRNATCPTSRKPWNATANPAASPTTRT
ncbi:MAG: biopolymer transporter ExbD [Kiritimatiellia bacterium]